MTVVNQTRGIARFTTVLAVILVLILSLTLLTSEALRAGRATDIVNGKRVIGFAGQKWIVKSGCGLGPGPNCWSDSNESVWVEGGQLHLKLRQIKGVWHSAEVVTQACTQYGMHRFFTIGRIDDMDKQVVAAMFLYKDDLTEVDIEFSKWGQINPSDNGQYVLQPYTAPGNLEPFFFTLNGDFSTHYFNWQETAVQFKSIHGHYEEPPTPGYLIHEWLYTSNDIPTENECLKIHVNLWLFQGMPPSDKQEVELIISKAQIPQQLYLPMAVTHPTALPSPWITVTANNNSASGQVGPSSYCNSNYKVALYAKTDIWYIQPFATPPPNIQIDANCEWESSTNTWYEIAAHLVPVDYFPPNTIGLPVPPCPPLDPHKNPNVLATDCHP